MRKNILTVGSAAVAIVAALALSGCGGDSGPRGTGLDSVLGGGGSGNSGSSENSGGGNSGSGGNESSGGSGTPDVNVNMNGSIPDGWPGEVVVPEGDISFSGTVDNGFTLIMTAKKTAVEAAIDQLKRNGFTEQTNFMGEQGGVIALDNADWSIGLLVGTDDAASDEWSVIYTVTPR